MGADKEKRRGIAMAVRAADEGWELFKAVSAAVVLGLAFGVLLGWAWV